MCSDPRLRSGHTLRDAASPPAPESSAVARPAQGRASAGAVASSGDRGLHGAWRTSAWAERKTDDTASGKSEGHGLLRPAGAGHRAATALLAAACACGGAAGRFVHEAADDE